MRVPSVYLETTIFNFPFADHVPQYRDDTLQLFREIRAGKFRPFTSDYVIVELEDTKDVPRREKMKALVGEYGVEVLPKSDEILQLAEVYVSHGVIPRKFLTDALHIAAASVHNLDFIVSLNFRHIVKHKTIIRTGCINADEGYKQVFIHAPSELTDHEQNT